MLPTLFSWLTHRNQCNTIPNARHSSIACAASYWMSFTIKINGEKEMRWNNNSSHSWLSFIVIISHALPIVVIYLVVWFVVTRRCEPSISKCEQFIWDFGAILVGWAWSIKWNNRCSKLIEVNTYTFVPTSILISSVFSWIVQAQFSKYLLFSFLRHTHNLCTNSSVANLVKHCKAREKCL